MSDVRHCLRNLIEFCNLDLDNFGMDVSEGLLDMVMEGKLRVIYDNGELMFQNSEFKEEDE